MGVVKTLTVKRDALGDIYLTFSCDKVPDDSQNRVMTGKSAGSDFGIKQYLTRSSGETTDSPEFFKSGMRKVKSASRALSRKKKASSNRTRARKHLARVHRKIANQRLDFSMKLAREMAIRHDYLFFEDLDIAALKQLWGRKVSDMGFADYLEFQEHMCRKHGSVLEKIPRYYPSSKQCHACGSVNKVLNLKDRKWTCPSCGSNHDRDLNASIVIHMVGASNH
jgi:putative transposase